MGITNHPEQPPQLNTLWAGYYLVGARNECDDDDDDDHEHDDDDGNDGDDDDGDDGSVVMVMALVTMSVVIVPLITVLTVAEMHVELIRPTITANTTKAGWP